MFAELVQDQLQLVILVLTILERELQIVCVKMDYMIIKITLFAKNVNTSVELVPQIMQPIV